MKSHTFFGHTSAWIRKFFHDHKIWSTIIIVIVVCLSYYIYSLASSSTTETQYVLTRVGTGTIAKTVTGTGQITAQDQRDVSSEVSGKLQSINVSVGQKIKSGDLIAVIDPSDALNTLKSAEIAFAKLTQAPTQTELDSAKNSVNQSYNSALGVLSDASITFETIMPEMDSMLYDQDTFLSNQTAMYLSQTARSYRDKTGVSYDLADRKHADFIKKFRTISRSSASSTIIDVLDDAYLLSRSIADAVQNAQNAVDFIATNQSEYMSQSATLAKSSVSTWSSSINSITASLLSSRNSITSNENTLRDLIAGADDLDIESQRLSLSQTQKTYSKYFIRAPFDGVVGRIPVKVGDTISGSTVIATVVGESKTTTISLSEIDAVRVKAGNRVDLTFDAIDGLTATGTVASVDLVGTVSSGVVSYSVKIDLKTIDDRILAGMSVNVTIITQEQNDVIVVPSGAITTQNNKSFVKIVNYEGNSANASSTSPRSQMIGSTSHTTKATVSATSVTPRLVEVTLGISDDTNSEIRNGISSGDWIVTQTVSSGSSGAASKSSSSVFNLLSGKRTTGNTSSSRTTGAGGPPGGF